MLSEPLPPDQPRYTGERRPSRDPAAPPAAGGDDINPSGEQDFTLNRDPSAPLADPTSSGDTSSDDLHPNDPPVRIIEQGDQPLEEESDASEEDYPDSGLTLYEKRVLDRLNIPSSEKQMELILALRDAGSWGNMFEALSLPKKMLVLTAPVLVLTVVLLTVFGLNVAAVHNQTQIALASAQAGNKPVLVNAVTSSADIGPEGASAGTAASGASIQHVVGVASAVVVHNLLNYAELSTDILTRVLSVNLVLDGAFHHYKVASFIKYANTHMVLFSADGSEIRVQNGVVFLKRPYESQKVVSQALVGDFAVRQEL